MKRLTLSLVAVCSLLLTGLTTARADATDYQVTGPILSMTDTTITVQKGKEKWEINKGTVAGAADLKVGDKVTVHYTMTATTIEAKPAAAKAGAAKAAAKAAKPAADAAPASSPVAQ